MFLQFVTIFVGIYVQYARGTPLLYSDNVSRIIGGEDAPKEYATHMVALVVLREELKERHLVCGGSIISRRHVMTAAHCNDQVLDGDTLTPNLRGVVGWINWRDLDNDVKFSHHKNHPNWDATNTKYDVGLLFLVQELVFSDEVSPLALSFDWIGGGVDTYVTGWGRTGPRYEDDILSLSPLALKLQLLYVQTITHQECLEGIQEADIMGSASLIKDVEICTFHSVDHGMCVGDSGSALILKDSGKQIGIVSWGFACALGVPDVFTRLSGVQDFLVETLAEENIAI